MSNYADLKLKKDVEEFDKIAHRFSPSFEGYFQNLKDNYSIKTARAYASELFNYFGYVITKRLAHNLLSVKEITIQNVKVIKPEDVNEYISLFARETGCNVRTLCRKRSSVASFFKYLYNNGLITQDIASGIDIIKYSAKRREDVNTLTESEIKKVLYSVRFGVGLSDQQLRYWDKTKQRDLSIVAMFLKYGLTLSELESLNVNAIDFASNTFELSRDGDVKVIIPLDSQMISILRTYLNGEHKLYYHSDNYDALFLSLQGTRLTSRQIRELVKKYTMVALKIDEGYSPTMLRATCARRILDRGGNPKEVAKLLGHESLQTTLLYKTEANAGRRKRPKEKVIVSDSILIDN